MKKNTIFALLLTLCLFVSLTFVSSAADYGRLWDEADLLSDYEEASITAQLDEISHRLNFDVVIVTVNSTGGKSPMAYADDFFDYNGYGMGASRDGVLLLLAMDSRDWWISTSGWGITAFTDAGIEYIGEEILFDLSNGFYGDAFSYFAELCDSFVQQARTGDPYDYHNLYDSSVGFPAALGISLIVGLIVAALYTGSLKAQLNSVRRKPEATEYVRKDSLQITQSKDLFLYRNVNRTVKQTSSGGSSTHTSSSGRSHGGGGGRF